MNIIWRKVIIIMAHILRVVQIHKFLRIYGNEIYRKRSNTLCNIWLKVVVLVGFNNILFNPIMLKASFGNCRLERWYFWQYLLNWELFYKLFEGELLVMFWSWFLLQIFCQLCKNLKDFFRIVRMVLAAVSINGLRYFSNLVLFGDFLPIWSDHVRIPDKYGTKLELIGLVVQCIAILDLTHWHHGV